METEGFYLIYTTRTDNLFPDTYRNQYHVHILVHAGEMRFATKRKTFNAHANDLVIWQMTTPMLNISYSDDFDADFLLISNEFLGQFNPEMVYATKGYVFIKSQPVIPLQGDFLEVINNDFRQCWLRIRKKKHLFQDEAVGCLLQLLLYDMWNVIEEELDKTEIDDNASRIFLKFLFLLEEHCKTEREVQFYSEKLCIVPKYLSEICRNISGTPASAWIESFTANELRHLLSNRQLTLTDIADEMNFSSMSFFSRYAKKVLGVSPTEFRKNLT